MSEIPDQCIDQEIDSNSCVDTQVDSDLCMSDDIKSNSCIDKQIESDSCIGKEINSTACIPSTKPIEFDYEIYQEVNEIGFVAYIEATNGLQGVIEVKES